jgi:hypothetical protein
LQQDALQATLNRWNFQKYDAFDREVIRGEITNTATQAAIQTAFNTHATPDEEWNAGSGYTTFSFPSSYNPIFAEVQQFNFYDQYDFRNSLAPSFTFDPTTAFHQNYVNVKGISTGNVSFNSADHSKYYINVLFYDKKGRVIQTYNTDVKSTANNINPAITNIQYNFASEEIYRLETANFAAPLSTQTTRTQTLRDHVGRSTLIKHGINTSSLTDLDSYSYDEVGRQTRKSILPNGVFTAFGTLDYINRPPSPALGTQDLARKAINLLPGTSINGNYLGVIDPTASGGNTIKGLQHVDYSWHIRGTMLGVNLDNAGHAIPNNSEGDLFANKYEYENLGQFGGNIAKQTWTAKNIAQNNETRSYTYAYDNFDRLKASVFAGVGTENYSSQNISYDKNGNLKTFTRNGVVGSAFGAVDNLTYTYAGNKLLSVSDAVTGNTSTKDFRDNNAGIDYTYWPNGAIKSDANRGVDSIITNTFLKKTSRVKYANGNWINFTYDGAGMLIKRENSLGEIWEYTASHVFKNNSYYEQKIPEGRAIFENNEWKPEFEYRDIFGNLRLSFAAENGALIQKQRADYDAFGWIFNENIGNTKNYRQFQNQNRVEDFGLDIDIFKYRASDPQIGRLWSVDPLASSYVYNSPYALQENKFGRGVELEGLELMTFPLSSTTMLRPIVAPIRTLRIPVIPNGTTLAPMSSTQNHHVNPQALKNHPVIQEARNDGFKQDGNENKIPLQKYNKETGDGQHGGSHPKYNEHVKTELDNFGKANPVRQAGQSLDFVRGLVKELKTTIENNQTTKINDLFKVTIPIINADNTRIAPQIDKTKVTNNSNSILPML